MQSQEFSRRDFIKLFSLLSLAFLPGINRLDAAKGPKSSSQKPGVIILVLDSLSAKNLSFCGYPRETTPNLNRFIERANVYHAHYSPANFTTPGTASLLSGTYPWTHRAFHYEGQISSSTISSNIFKLFDEYHRLAYTQNPWADLLLYQFSPWIDKHIDLEALNLTNDTVYNGVFIRDPLISYKGMESYAFSKESSLASSSFLALLRKIIKKSRDDAIATQNSSSYPINIPITKSLYSLFRLEDVIDGLILMLEDFSPSKLAYLHIYPPHYPYAPHKDHLDRFEDSWTPVQKKVHSLSHGLTEEELNHSRQLYDTYIYSLDVELSRLLDFLGEKGILENNYLIITSDHGEMFERGEAGHTNPFLYEPLVHIPLVISIPGQTERRDYFTPTSNVDLLPTLLSLLGYKVPEFCEGSILPGLGGEEIQDRPVYFIDTKSTPAHGPIQKATFGMRRGRYKIIQYYGYSETETFTEVYDLENDPEELNPLNSTNPVTLSLQSDMDEKLRAINVPFKEGIE